MSDKIINPVSIEEIRNGCDPLSGCLAWQHINYYLDKYTKLPLLEGSEPSPADNPSILWAYHNQGLIVEALLRELGVEVWND